MSALAALTLSGCATSGSFATYPELPADLKTCFDSIVPQPDPGSMSKAQVMRLIANLKQSETVKVACGKRLIAFYESLADTKGDTSGVFLKSLRSQ